eukprot:9142948-Pyramimonas_sp.AAC.1
MWLSSSRAATCPLPLAPWVSVTSSGWVLMPQPSRVSPRHLMNLTTQASTYKGRCDEAQIVNALSARCPSW